MHERYNRQILFPQIGASGQKLLAEATVAIIGCGALGSTQAEMLARAGVGNLRVVDRDFVDFTNLQRQTLFSESDAAERLPKAVAAKRRIGEINSAVEIDAVITDVNASNVEQIISGCDAVLDGTDNFQARYLLNDACVKHSCTWIYGAAVSGYGATMTVIPSVTACLRCIFDEIPDAGTSPTCDTAGVIMPIIASIAAVQVTEALKVLIGRQDELHGSLMQIDIWESDWRKIRLGTPDKGCRACGLKIFDFLDLENQSVSAVLCGRDAVQVAPSHAAKIDLDELAKRLEFISGIRQNEYLVRFSADECEVTVFGDARAIVRGTDDIARARSLYARFVGT